LFGRPGDAPDSARLDAIAHHRRALGLPALSLHVARADTAAQGIAEAPARSLTRALDRGIGSNLGRLVVMDPNLRHWFESYPGAAGAPFFDAVETRAPDRPTAFAARLAAASVSERGALLEEHLTHQLSLTLQRDPVNLSRRATFQGMGMGSIMAVELRNRLESTLGIRLSVALLFTYSTVAALAEFIADELAVTQPSARQPDSESEDEPSLMADLDLLSDAEAEAMLLDSIRLVEQELGND
jgi:myxalamid-type polyketide synthase MxaF